jgi:hypothetical protein
VLLDSGFARNARARNDEEGSLTAGVFRGDVGRQVHIFP